MTRSVYLLAFIASATVVSAEMTWTLSDQAACAALGARVAACGADKQAFFGKLFLEWDPNRDGGKALLTPSDASSARHRVVPSHSLCTLSSPSHVLLLCFAHMWLALD